MDHNTIDPNVRLSYILKNNEWVKVNGMDIKEGMTFKMYEPDGITPVLDYNGKAGVFIASSDSYMDDCGIIHTHGYPVE